MAAALVVAVAVDHPFHHVVVFHPIRLELTTDHVSLFDVPEENNQK